MRVGDLGAEAKIATTMVEAVPSADDLHVSTPAGVNALIDNAPSVRPQCRRGWADTQTSLTFEHPRAAAPLSRQVEPPGISFRLSGVGGDRRSGVGATEEAAWARRDSAPFLSVGGRIPLASVTLVR
jgi:hypothetical protein